MLKCQREPTCQKVPCHLQSSEDVASPTYVFSVSSTLPAKICYLSFTFIAQFTVSIATPLRIQLFHSKRGREVAGKEVSLYNATPGRKLLLELSWLTSTALLKPKRRVTSPWDSPGAASGERNHRRIFFPPGFMNK